MMALPAPTEMVEQCHSFQSFATVRRLIAILSEMLAYEHVAESLPFSQVVLPPGEDDNEDEDDDSEDDEEDSNDNAPPPPNDAGMFNF